MKKINKIKKKQELKSVYQWVGILFIANQLIRKFGSEW